MPNDSIDEALKEVYALAPNDRVVLDTLEISHPSLVESLYMVKDHREWDLTIEGGLVKTFEPVPFRDQVPATGDNGIQDYSVSIDNIDRRVSDFLESVKSDPSPVQMKRRQYLSTDPTNQLINPPLTLYLTSVQINAFEVVGKATFGDPVNQAHPGEKYTRNRFPALG